MIKRILNNVWFDISHPSLAIFRVYIEFIYSTINARLTKSRDYSSEVFFWKQLYYRCSVSGMHPEWWNSELTKDRYSKEMKEILDILSKDFNEELKLIDVGSGPVTSFFQKLDINVWNIVTVDPLAELYNDLNETYKVNYPIKCIEGTGEHLDELFEPNSFHLVLSQNSIDHSESPIAYINCLYYLCKPGGFIYISGHIKVGSSEHWVGLHKHDLYVVDDNLYWTSHDKKADNLNTTEKLDMSLYYKQIDGSMPGDNFVLVYRKNS